MADYYKLQSTGAEIDEILNALKQSWTKAIGLPDTWIDWGPEGSSILDSLIIGIGFYPDNYYGQDTPLAIRRLGNPSRIEYVYSDSSLCLREGTMILMADGTEKAIEEIQPGDMIKSYDLYNNKFIDVKTYGSKVTGAEKDWKRMVFDNGAYLDIYGKHNIFTPSLGGRIVVSTNWKHGDYAFVANGDTYATPKFAQMVDLSTPERVKRYRITCENCLYFANGILTGSAPEEMYDFTKTKTIVGASEEEIARLKEIDYLHDAYVNREKNNIPYMVESAPIYEKRNEAVAKRKAAKEELASLDFKTVKRQQGLISDEEWVTICEKCEALRAEVNKWGLEAWRCNKELGKLKEKHGIESKNYGMFWREAYGMLMTDYYARKGETVDTSVLKAIEGFEAIQNMLA